jgi:hypothetical protein
MIFAVRRPQGDISRFLSVKQTACVGGLLLPSSNFFRTRQPHAFVQPKHSSRRHV